LVGIFAQAAGVVAQSRVAQIGEVGLVDLKIAAARRRKIGDLLPIDSRQIRVELFNRRIGRLVDGVAAAAEMQQRWRGNCDLRRGLRRDDRLEKFEVLHEDRAHALELARDLHRGRLLQRYAIGAVKAHRHFRGHERHVLEAQQKVTLPAAAIIFAVCDALETEIFLQLHDARNGGLLDLLELVFRNLLGFEILPRLTHIVGADKGADLVGAKRRFASLGHVSPNACRRFSDLSPLNAGLR